MGFIHKSAKQCNIICLQCLNRLHGTLILIYRMLCPSPADRILHSIPDFLKLLLRKSPKAVHLSLLAGLQSVDKSQLEAARIDGATFMQTLRHVTLPTIRPVVLSSVWIAIMNNFQMYTIINLMTGGGPSEATYTLSIAAYEKAFTDYNFGQGAAIGVMWLVFLTIVTVIINKISAKSAENL